MILPALIRSLWLGLVVQCVASATAESWQSKSLDDLFNIKPITPPSAGATARSLTQRLARTVHTSASHTTRNVL